MALKIRLARAGSKKRPYYHIVVADVRSPRDGRFIEAVGAWNPLLPKDGERVKLDEERVKHWLAHGALPTDRVLRFLDQAGISKATILIKGENAYGYAKAERGVHRLVRISPFDANKRRHTSFCAVDVVAEINEEINIEVPDSDIRIDVYRSSGKGGQGVNTTDSAVRITHIPTGVVVVCQNERSQTQHKAVAMQLLKSKLIELEERKRSEELAKARGEVKDVAWGSQIRSYVLHPYTMVKDHRTEHEVGDVQRVLDGDLDEFVRDYLNKTAAASAS